MKYQHSQKQVGKSAVGTYVLPAFFQSFQAAKSPEPAMVAILTRYSILLDCK